MIVLIIFAFIAGIVTILSPCILPVLPIVMAGSLHKGWQRPLGIVIGFVSSFTFFTLFLTTIVSYLGINPSFLRWFAIVVIGLFGLSLLLPPVQTLLERVFSYFSQFAPQSNRPGLLGGILIGFSLGLVWTPCVGPILASVISLAIIGSVNGGAVAITLAYALGTALPMLAMMMGGQRVLRSKWLLKHTNQIQRFFGALMVVIAIAMGFDLDRTFQTKLLEIFPYYGAGLTKIEESPVVSSQLQQLQLSAPNQSTIGQPTFELNDPLAPAAPDLIGGGPWINSLPLSLRKELKNKVVLVDFWTYSCINCVRTFPYLKQWYQTYKDQDFVIVGVHSPEFEFEKDTANVTKAVKDFGLEYPIVQDNALNIWRAYGNQYWPAHYLIDKQGKIRYTHFGEGMYVETENQIRALLNEPVIDRADNDFSTRPLTPETYLGYDRADAYTVETDILFDKDVEYTASSPLPDDAVALSGKWRVAGEYIESKADNAELRLNFTAGDVYLVMAPATKMAGTVTVLLDDQPVPGGTISVEDPKMYLIVHLGNQNLGRHILKLRFSSGVRAYAFTFG